MKRDKEEEEEEEEDFCVECGSAKAYLRAKNKRNEVYCSRECAKARYQRMYRELETILRENFQTCRVRNADDKWNLVLNEDIQSDLLTRGVCLVKLGNPDIHQQILNETNANIVATFPRLNNVNTLVQELNTRNYEDLQIWGTGKGMISTPPIDTKTGYPLVTHPVLKTVECKNQILAKNNIRMWEILTRYNPLLHPREWFSQPLCSPGYRTQVSEDGIKIKKDKAYDPTAIHYDGQLSESLDGSTRRVQIIYTTDTGPVRLFAVPGSHLPRVRQIIQTITGIESKDGFARANFEKTPRILELLHKYGVSIGSSPAGLLMFCANV